MGSLDDKEPFYAHFPKFGPSGPNGGGGGRYGPPHSWVNRKKPTLGRVKKENVKKGKFFDYLQNNAI